MSALWRINPAFFLLSLSACASGKSDSADAVHCTTDADGWVTCDLSTWSTSLDPGEPPVLDGLAEDVCAVPYDDGNSGALCAVAGVLAHKAQTFGVDSTSYELDVPTVYNLLQQYHVRINEEGGATESIGSCPDTLRDSSVFQFLWCNQSTSHAKTNMVYATNKLQDEYHVQVGADRADVGTWLGITLTDDPTNSADLDDLWFAVFWSNNHFGTTSSLTYHDEDGRLMTMVIRGLGVSAEWQVEDADALGLSSDEIARLLSDFVANPFSVDPPPAELRLRLRLGRIEFADWASGGATWPETSPSSIFYVHDSYTGEHPWNMSTESDTGSEGPLAIIDPVIEFDEADSAAGLAPLGSIADQGDELDALTLFVKTARDQGWKVVFGEAD